MRDREQPGLHAVIEGGIGAGKTTFCRESEEFLRPKYPEFVFLEEPVEMNPFLPLFLQDMKRYAYTMQSHLLHARFKFHKKAATVRSFGGAAILDRGVWGDVCFARLAHRLGNMTDDELESYESMRVNMLDHLTYPDIVIWLNIPPEQQMARILRRQRPGESTGYTIAYLQGLQAEYERMLECLGQHTIIHEVQWMDYPDDEAIRSQVPYVWSAALNKIKRDWTGRQGW